MNAKKQVIFAVLAVASALGAGSAHAGGRADVQWSINIGGPIGIGLYSPAPRFLPPIPVPVLVNRGWQDRDHDGVPNRYDRVYNPRWDRDGDGVPNRYDRNDNRRSHDRDHDGVPKWRDRHDGRHGR